MAVIAFSADKPEEIWCVAGWAFRQVMEDVLSQFPGNSELADKFEVADLHSGLNIHLMEPEVAARVTDALWQVVTGILSGTIRSGIHDQPYGDERTVEEYRKGLKELLAAFPEAWKREHKTGK